MSNCEIMIYANRSIPWTNNSKQAPPITAYGKRILIIQNGGYVLTKFVLWYIVNLQIYCKEWAMKFRLFDEKPVISNRLEKNKSKVETTLVAFWGALFPSLSGFVSTLDGQRSVYKSLSYMAYRENHMGLIIFYGMLFVIGYMMTLVMCLDMGQYTKTMRVLFIGMGILSSVILTAGLSVPWLEVEGEEAAKFDYLRKVHNDVSAIGFIMFVITEALLFVTTIPRNGKQGMLSVGMFSFVLITGLYMIFEVNLKGIIESAYPISSIAQSYVFCSVGFAMLIQYFMMKHFPNEKFQPQTA